MKPRRPFSIVNVTKSGVIWATDKNGKQFIICRDCKEQPCDYFDPSRSRLDEERGWIEEWHVCKACVHKSDRERWRKEREARQEQERVREQEYWQYMDAIMEGVE